MRSRIIYKAGFIRRDTVEILMDKVESVDVDQSIMGRLLDYGTVTVRGTGASFEPLKGIAHPIELRSHIMGVAREIPMSRTSPLCKVSRRRPEPRRPGHRSPPNFSRLFPVRLWHCPDKTGCCHNVCCRRRMQTRHALPEPSESDSTCSASPT